MKGWLKVIQRGLVQNLIMIPIGALTSLVGWHIDSWEYWGIFVLCNILLIVQYNSIRNETLENLEKQLEH